MRKIAVDKNFYGSDVHLFLVDPNQGQQKYVASKQKHLT
jgi:hypothetical protein